MHKETTIVKFTTKQIKNLKMLYETNGVSTASDWNVISIIIDHKSIPIFSKRIAGNSPEDLKQQIAISLRGPVLAAAYRLVEKWPRIRSIVAITDLRNARKAIREHDFANRACTGNRRG